MAFQSLDHTADIGIEVRAASAEELFSEALRGMTDCVTDLAKVENRLARDVAVEAAELDALMVEWLSEGVYRLEVEDLLLKDATVELDRSAEGWKLVARVKGETFDSTRHPLKVPIKGVTYHQLVVEQREQGWFARVIFDI